MKLYVLVVAFFLMGLTTASAEPVAESDIPFRYTSWVVGYDVNVDGSFAESHTWSSVILKENVLEKVKQASVTFSTSVAKGEIIEAYTQKKSGKRVDVPKNSYQVSTEDGYNNNSPLYSDETTITVIFPDLAVGDTTVFSYRVTNSEGIFPGHFSMARHFSRFAAYDDVRIRITAPKSVKLRTESYFLTAAPVVEKDGKQTFEWTYRNKTPEKWTPAENGLSFVGDEPGLYVSTFNSYKQIVEAYGSRATPKAAVTDRIAGLASQIAGDAATPESKARSLYNWVAKNISYGGNCIGIGTVVPRDLNVVLDNKLGDCKDHATLLQALLEAKGIKSEQALVNSGTQYDLPKTPIVSAVNHVINYVPSLNVYLDSTASVVPFGVISPELGEKPVLLVTNFREGTKIPPSDSNSNSQNMKTTLRVKADGSAEGKVQIDLKGMPAVQMRAAMRVIPSDQMDLVARKLLEGRGYHGTAKLLKEDPTELLDTYSFSISFRIEDLFVVSSTIGMPIRPVINSPADIASNLNSVYEPVSKKSQACIGGRSTEEFSFEFPPELNLLETPKNYELNGSRFDYKATYKKNGNTLNVLSEFVDKTTSNICTPAHIEEYKKNARSVVQDIRSQVLISN
jgi:transglutaminase-like putative cysteine protease